MSELRVSLAVVLALAAVGFLDLLSTATGDPSGPEVVHDIYHDTSLPVSQYPSATPAVPTGLRVRPLPRRVLLISGFPRPDEAEQFESFASVSLTLSHNFDGIPDSANGTLAGVPPDSNLAVGATQVVEVINTAFQVYNKSTGASLLGPKQISSIFVGLPGLCGQGPTSPDYTDPIVLYDKLAGRWFIAIVAANKSFSTGNECIGVSTTSDATGSYHRYAFSFGTNVFNDYDKFGVWPDAYYGSYNLFSHGLFRGANACAYQRSAMLAGKAAEAICFLKSTEFGLLPSDLDGAAPPPAGEPDFFVALFTTSLLHLYRFHVDFVTPSNSKLAGPVSIAVKSFTQACAAAGTCIPQAGTSDELDSLGDRLMFRLAYRNFLTHESLVVNHAAQTSLAASGVRWYEIRSPNGTPKVFQQGTLTNGNTSLWMGSIAMDKVGDIALGFSESSSTIHPRIAFTGRVPSDPLGTMEGIKTVIAGNGSQTGGTSKGSNRWGDYTDMAIDPSNDCTLWYVNEYIPSNGDFNFRTRLASFKFPSCM